MQILIGKIRHFDYLSHISVNLSHTQKYKVCSINLCKVFHDVFCVFYVILFCCVFARMYAMFFIIRCVFYLFMKLISGYLFFKSSKK